MPQFSVIKSKRTGLKRCKGVGARSYTQKRYDVVIIIILVIIVVAPSAIPLRMLI